MKISSFLLLSHVIVGGKKDGSLIAYGLSQGVIAADGGRPWPSYVGQYAGARVHNYAVSGAVCSRNITPETIPATEQLFPDVDSVEIPSFFMDTNYTLPDGTRFIDLSPESTVFAIMIGGNDIGAHAFLTDSQPPGKPLPDYIDCVFEQIDRLYRGGARYFLLNKLGAMYLAPQYAMPEAGGVAASQYWPNKYSNGTAASQRMLQHVATVNAIYDLRTLLEVMYQKKYPGASFALVDLGRLVGCSA
ncbi:predicted protein [Aspergillus terreus NIH2624]|uniref:SGNH hydrolase-type esterase domain-containing protein n=1 Tax=Aspergillus terreus (strain NIH 2624 / FGSC A1156) TaxID=341663 RepID=Q0CRT6_ASPTN|nr:uncharacterized protein ATEG_03598 [Aspergillus terreus NIH2624]EAU35400.1 predicted protein [Aspergillus terreus NIH2624]